MEHAFLFLAGLCLVGLTLVLMMWDSEPRAPNPGRRRTDALPPRPTVPAANPPPKQP